MNVKDYEAGDWLALIGKIVIALIVAGFLGIHSLNLFEYVFPDEQSYNAWLGFGLTGGALPIYLIILLFAKNELTKAIAVGMVIVTAVGELIVAGLGVQVEVWKKNGMVFTEEELTMMVRVIQGLGFLHAFALIGQVAGEQIVSVFSRKKKEVKNEQPSTVVAPTHPLNIPKANGIVNRDETGFTD